MAEPEKQEDKTALDAGIDVGISRLTEDKIEKVVNAVIKGETGARFKVYVETCIHCGLCSEACHYYLSHDKDPHYSPVGKVKQTLWEMLRKKGRVSPEFIARAAVITHTECNLCKRCAQYCPFGIDIAYLMSVVRRIVHRLGCTPLYIQDTAHSHSVTMNQMWVKGDEWPDTLQWQEEEAQAEIPTLRIPLEKEGSEIMYSVIAPEPKFQAQLIYQTAVIMDVAGVNWTMPAGVGWDNSDMAMFTGDNEIMGRLKRCHYETALKLKVKKIVMGECGHAFRSVYDMGNRWLGWKMPPIPIVHAIEFYHDLIKAGKIKIAKKYPATVTLHDPCNVVRGGGLHEKARWLARELCEELIEMHPNREHNYCCAAGGGSNVGKRVPFAGGFLSLQDQLNFDLAQCSLLLMPEADAQMESLALKQGCLLLSHALESDSPAVFAAAGGTQPELGYTQTSLRLAGAELASLLPVLLELGQVAPIEHINITLLRSAEFHGRTGVDELASQTVNLLNSRSVEPGVYAQQIAFNVLPETSDPRIESDIRHFLGNTSYTVALQTVNVPIFHGLAAAVQLRFADDVSFEGCKSRLAELENVTVENGPVSPISDCNQSFNCVLSQFEQAPNQPAELRFWLVTDPMRYGLANNYVNVTDFLLKSYL